MMENGVAIDIGTSKVSVCITKENNLEQVAIDDAIDEYPSGIYYNNCILYGREAKEMGKKDPSFYFNNLKCIIGRKFSDSFVQQLKTKISYKIVQGEHDRLLVEVCEDNNKILKDPSELLSMVVNHVIQRLQGNMENVIRYLAVGFPPSFSEAQKEELRRVAVQTGIRHIELVPETTAACYFYGLKLSPDQIVLVVDCGASACNATLLKYCDDDFQVIGHKGSEVIGGNRYTELLVEYVSKLYKTSFCDVESLSQHQQATIYDSIERVKHMLRIKEREKVDPGIEGLVPVSLTGSLLKSICKKTNESICTMIETLIQTSNCKPTVLVICGKGMKLRCLSSAICERVGLRSPICTNDEPVVYGMAMYLAERVGYHHELDKCNTMDSVSQQELSVIKEVTSPNKKQEVCMNENKLSALLVSEEIPKVNENPCVTNPIPMVERKQLPISIPLFAPEGRTLYDKPPTEKLDIPRSQFSSQVSPLESQFVPKREPESVPRIPPATTFNRMQSVYPFSGLHHSLSRVSEESNGFTPIRDVSERYEEPTGFTSVTEFSETPEESNTFIPIRDVSETPEEPNDFTPVLDVAETPEEPDAFTPMNKAHETVIDSSLEENDFHTIDSTIQFHITETHKYNLSLGGSCRPGGDLHLLLSKETEIPCTIRKKKLFRMGKQMDFFLYEGNSRWKRESKRIRHLVLERDANHPPDKDWEFYITMRVNSTGLITMSFMWVDTNNLINVVVNEEVTNKPMIQQPVPIQRPVAIQRPVFKKQY